MGFSAFLEAFAPLPADDRLEVDGRALEYEIKSSSRRRTLCLQVQTDGRVRVLVPAHARLHHIRDFIAGRLAWVERTRRAVTVPVRPLHDGAPLPFLGEALVLRHGAASKAPAVRRGRNLWVHARDSATVRLRIERWYRSQAQTRVAARIAHFAPRVGRAPARLSIRGQKTRWGSCSSLGNININWRLLLADAAILDYVVVHELCHLLHRDHSPRFWREVARVLPDYRETRRRLRACGPRLVL